MQYQATVTANTPQRVRVVTIDLRMWNASGIGRYLNALVPILVRSFPSCHFHLLGDMDVLSAIKWPDNTTLHAFSSPIYSIAEQFLAPLRIPAETDLLWWPHYNVPLFFRGRLVVTIYDAYHLCMRGSLGDLVKRRYAELLFGAVRRRAEKVFTISHFSKDEVVALARVPAERIVPIHLGVAPEWFDTKAEEGFRERPYVLFVGNVKPHKNLRRLIAAFAGLVDVIPHDLVIVGKRDGFITGDEEVARMAAALGDRVAFTGWVDDSDLRRYVANAALMVFPSIYEGFGLPPLEAMACVCPVAASDIPVIHEVCGDQVAYFDPTSVEAIRDCIAAELSAPREVADAVEWARRYDWEDCIDATVAEFSMLFGLPAMPVHVKDRQ